LNLTAGYAVIMQGREPEARDYFNRALDAVPDLTLDPVQVSPKFRVVFNEVKAARPKEPPREEQVTGESGDSPRREDSTIQALRPAPRSQVMNLILPGSGHWREGKKVRGAVWFGLSAASVGVLVWRIGEMRDSRADYLAQTDAERIADSYDTYNRDYQLTWAAGIAAGLVYLGSQVDLTLMKRETSETTLRFAPTQDGVKLALSW
ncbi:hypothetical protein KJ815_04220, partial [bacterium]|nr:hypothetical protein [bacterium]